MRRMTSIALLPTLLLALLLAGCDQEQSAQEAAEPADKAAETQADQTAAAEESAAEPNISVHFVTPEDGATVTSPFEVEMAAEGVDVVPAGTMEEGTGHMHILVDVPFVMPGNVIPSDEQHIHYGDGSTTATLDLEPGEHVLRLQLADGAHMAFEGEEYRDVIRVEVEGREAAAAENETPEDRSGGDEEG